MTPDRQIEKLILELEPTNEKGAAIIRELLIERRSSRLRLHQLAESRDFFKRQAELHEVFSSP